MLFPWVLKKVILTDNLSVTTSTRTVSEIEQHLVEDADKVSKWCSDKRMAKIQLKQR